MSSFAGSNFFFTLTMSGLTAGHQYQFEWWNNTSTGTLLTDTTAVAGNSVTLLSNTTFSVGGLGQFAVGTFTADGADPGDRLRT